MTTIINVNSGTKGSLIYVIKMVSGMPKIRVDYDGVYQGCASGKHVKGIPSLNPNGQ